jgi:hypothetical protein
VRGALDFHGPRYGLLVSNQAQIKRDDIVDWSASGSRGVFSGEKKIPARRAGIRWVLETDVSGTVTLEVR